MEKRWLGRGLDALVGSGSAVAQASAVDQLKVQVGRIEQNPFQPRKEFDDDDLASLSESIRTHGVLQPLVVRPVGEGGRFQLVAGERRLRAAQAIGVKEVPVRVVNFNDQEVLEAALIENIQRADLNPIEKAQGFQEYLQRFEMTHEDLAKRLGLDRSTMTNLVRLLELPPEVQTAVRVGQISAGHARALLGVSDSERQAALCKEIVAKGLSVRATEALVKEQKPESAAAGGTTRSEPKPAAEKTAHVQAMEDELRQGLATRVEIRLKAKDKGQILLSFENNDDFDRLMGVLRQRAA